MNFWNSTLLIALNSNQTGKVIGDDEEAHSKDKFEVNT